MGETVNKSLLSTPYVMKACPPGVICVESTVLVLVVFVALALSYYVYSESSRATISPQQVVVEQDIIRRVPEVSLPISPYAQQMIPPPPTPVFYGNTSQIPGKGPYQQVGFLSGGGQILPLMGRPLAPGRDTWQYYTASDTGYGIQLPLSKSGRSCTGEYGCQSLWNGDEVYVEGYNQLFRVTMYERNGIPYSPFV